MELDRLEVVFDGDLEPFDEKLDKFEQKLDSLLGRVKSSSDRNMNSIEQNFNGFKGFDKFTKQFGRLNSNFENQMNRLNQTAKKQGESSGENLTSGFSKGAVKLTEDVQSAVDKINLKMQQAKAAQSKLSRLTSDRNGAKLSGDSKGASKFEDKIANAQIQMNRSQKEAQAIARKLKSEYDAIPQSLNTISEKMESNETLIESMRAKVKALKEEMKSQQIETGSFASGKWQSTGVKNTPKSIKTSENITQQAAKMEKLIAENDALQRSYAQMEERSNILKSALSGVTTELGKASSSTKMASNGMKNLSGASQRSEGVFSKLKKAISSSFGKVSSLFNRQSNKITKGTSKMSQGMGGFSRSLRMLWSQLFIFTVLYQGVMALADGFYKSLQTNAQFSNSLNQIKVNLLTAFYPIYQAALPAINTLMAGLSKATGYIASFIAALTGMSVGDAFNGAHGLMDNVQALDATGKAAEGASDGYDEMVKSIRDSNKQLKKQHDQAEAARKKALELKRVLTGFDELHILDFKSDQSTDSFKPQEIPDKPKKNKGSSNPWADFGSAKIPDTPKWLSDFANKFKSTLAKLFDPIKQAWDAKGQLVMDSWKYALSEVGGLIEAVGKSFMDVWTNGTGTKYISNVLILLSDILNIVGDVARAFKDAWKENDRGTKLVQQVFDALNQWLTVLHDIAQTFRNVWNNGTGVEIAKQLLDFFTNIFHLLETIGRVFKAAWDDNGNGEALIQTILSAFSKILKLINSITKSFDSAFSSGIGESILSNIFQIATNIFNVVGNLAESFRQAWNENSRGQSIFKGILGIINTVLDTVKKMTGATSDWAQKLDFRPLLNAIKGLLDAIKPLTKNIGDGLNWFYQNVLLPLASYTIENVIPTFLGTLSGAIDVLNSVIDALKPLFKWLWDSMLQPIATWTGGIIVDVLKKLGEKLKKLSDWIDKHQEAVQNFVLIITSFAATAAGISAVTGAFGALMGILEPLVAIISSDGILGALGALVGLLGGPLVLAIGAAVAAGVLIYKNWDKIKAKASELKNWIGGKFSAISGAVSKSSTAVGTWISTKWTSAESKVKATASTMYNTAKDKFSGIANTVGSYAESARSSATSAFSNLHSAVSGKLGTLKATASDVFSSIGGWASGLPGKISSGLSSGISAIGGAISRVASAMIRPIAGAVNSIIGGINWVLGSVNSSWRLPRWDIPRYASGTTKHPGGVALVNDGQGDHFQEYFKLPNGQIGLFPKQRNMLVDLPSGTQVMPSSRIPHYSAGIFDTFKDFFSHGFDKAKGVASDTWSILSNPSKLVDMAMNKFTHFGGMLEPMFSISKGILGTVKTSVVDMVWDMIDKVLGFSEGGKVSKAGLYQLAEGDNEEWIIPVTKPQLAIQRINEALDFMGYGELEMPEVFNNESQSNNGGSTSTATKNAVQKMSVSGNGLSDLSSGLIQNLGATMTESIMKALSTMKIGQNSGPIEITLEVNEGCLGKVVINEINKTTQAIGVSPLML